MSLRLSNSLAIIGVMAMLFTGTSLASENPETSDPKITTTSSVDIPVEELKLLINPLTKEALWVEVDAWYALLQDKAREIADVEIAAKQKSREIEDNAAIEASAENAKTPSREGDEVAEFKKTEKVGLLERVNELREERTGLIDRLNAILDELKSKVRSDDTDSLSKIADYRLYIRSVSGIQVDVKDTTSAWIAIKGWLMSKEGGLRWLKNIALFVFVIFIAMVLSKLLSRALHRALQISGGISQLLDNFLVRTVRWVVWIVGILMALAALEVSVGPLLAIVGAAGFVIAFALQDSLSNFASGLMILFFRPFDVGDVVDAGGVSGKVVSMNLVSTTIKTFDNKDMVVPNNMIWNNVITNATGVTTRRVDMEFGIGYDDDIDQAQKILEDIVFAHPKVLKDPEPVIRMHTLADSSVNFICRPWARTEELWDVYWDITKEVKKRFDAEGIGIPYPQRDVHLYIEDNSPASILKTIAKEPASDTSKHKASEVKHVPSTDGGLDG